MGKALMGIRVVDLDGRALDFSQALLRSGGYILSSFLYLGFLWPLFNHRLQGFHDLIAGTVVIQDESRPSRSWVVAGGWATAAVIVGHWVWVFVLSTPYYRLKTVSNAYVALHDIARLEEQYKAKKGYYTDNIYKLARFTGVPQEFLQYVNGEFSPEPGLKLEVVGKKLRLITAARDEKLTPIQLEID